MNIEKARTNLLLADNLADFMKYLDEAVALKMLICEPKGDPLDVERFNELHAEYEKLDIERLEDYKDSKAFLGVSAQNLITLLDRLVKDLYMDEKIPYNDKNDQLLSCLEYFQLRVIGK
jgi:hypothetical protein